jgi:hypothetical protein
MLRRRETRIMRVNPDHLRGRTAGAHGDDCGSVRVSAGVSDGRCAGVREGCGAGRPRQAHAFNRRPIWGGLRRGDRRRGRYDVLNCVGNRENCRVLPAPVPRSIVIMILASWVLVAKLIVLMVADVEMEVKEAGADLAMPVPVVGGVEAKPADADNPGDHQSRPRPPGVADHGAAEARHRCDSNLDISQTFRCCDRCTAPSGVFSPRGARRTARARSVPRGIRPASPASSVAHAISRGFSIGSTSSCGGQQQPSRARDVDLRADHVARRREDIFSKVKSEVTKAG